MIKKYWTYTLIIFVFIISSIIFVNINDISTTENKKPNLNDFLTRIENTPNRWRKRLDKMKGVINYEVYKLKIPDGWFPSDQFNSIQAYLLGEKINLFRQYANEPRSGSYFYNGEILRAEKGRERTRYGNVSVTFQNNHVAGEIYIGNRYAKIVTLDSNIFALAEYATPPEYICGLDGSRDTKNNSENDGGIGIKLPNGGRNNIPSGNNLDSSTDNPM